MREAPMYQEIIQEGMQRGRQEEALSYTLRLLTRRIGEVAPQLQARIQDLTTAQLEELGEALLDFTNISDLVAWLQRH